MRAKSVYANAFDANIHSVYMGIARITVILTKLGEIDVNRKNNDNFDEFLTSFCLKTPVYDLPVYLECILRAHM